MGRRCLCSVTALGAFLVLVGALAVGLVPWIIENTIRSSWNVATPTSSLYKSFKNSSAQGVAVYKTFYFYNVSNAARVVSHGEVPHLDMMGPFTVREIETYNETVTTWYPNATMQYRSFTVYEPQYDMSADFNMNITVARPPFFAARKMAWWINDLLGKQNPLVEGLLTYFMEHYLLSTLMQTDPFVTRSAYDLLYGYNDTLMNELNKMTGSRPSLFGLNPNTDPEVYANSPNDECYTGGEPSDTQPPIPNHSYRWMTKWHGMTSLPGYWQSEAANAIAGTDATAFHPFIKKGEALLGWVNSLQRKVTLTYDSEQKVKGIPVYRHVIDPNELLSASKVPSNADYFMTHDGWLPSPPSEISRPVNYTKAMFLDTDTSIVNVTGLPSWSRDDLDTYLDIEPYTGSVLQVHKRIQVSVQMSPVKWEEFPLFWCIIDILLHNTTECHTRNQTWPLTANLPVTMLPVFWLDQHMLIPDKIADDVKNSLLRPLLAAKVVGGLGIAVGVVLMISCLVAFVLHLRRQERNYQQHEFYLINNQQNAYGA